MELDLVRKELNNYDNIIKNMINLRMALIPIVTDIKIKNNLPFYQGKREEEIYNNLEIFAKENGLESNLIRNIYKLIIQNALKIEEDIANNKSISVINNKDLHNNNLQIEDIKQEFQKLDDIIQNEIPDILLKLKTKCETNNLNLNQLATLYYNWKLGQLFYN